MTMVFVREEAPKRAVFDAEKDVRISNFVGFRDMPPITAPFTFAQGNLTFDFEVGFETEPVEGHRRSKAAYIIENNFKNTLALKRKKIGLPPMTADEYSRYRALASEGLKALVETNPHNSPAPGFTVQFEESFQSWIQRIRKNA